MVGHAAPTFEYVLSIRGSRVTMQGYTPHLYALIKAPVRSYNVFQNVKGIITHPRKNRHLKSLLI